MSVGNAFIEFDFLESKFVLITGSNGSGKSTLIEALCFVLFNRPFRNINKPQLVNSINKKDLVVEVEFQTKGKSYLVRRGLKPAIFEIYENGVLINPPSSALDYQKYLENSILHYSFKAFIHIVVLGSANFTPFMELSAQERRKITEEFNELNVFSTMNKLLKEKVSDHERHILKLDSKIQNLSSLKAEKLKSKTNLQGLISKSSSQYEDLIKECANQILEFEESVVKLNEEKASLQKQFTTEERNRVAQSIVDAKKSLAAYRIEVSKIREHVQHLQSEQCGYCRQKISEDFREEQLEDIATKSATIVAESENLKTLLAKNETVQQEIDQNTQRIFDIAQEIEQLNLKISQLKETISKYENKKNEVIDVSAISKIEAEIEKIDCDLSAIDVEYQNLVKMSKVYSAATELLKDSGIKAKIISQHIPAFNSILAQNLEALNLPVSFEIDEEFKEVIKSRYQDEFSYASFSQGERARINLALLFTWRTLARKKNKLSTNILILDEVFDGSLDGNGGDDLLNIIEEFSEGASIIVISHKTDSYVERFDKVFRVKKVKGFTEMLDAA